MSAVNDAKNGKKYHQQTSGNVKAGLQKSW
jgi:hypothetical protein